jgi:hypothetical protein
MRSMHVLFLFLFTFTLFAQTSTLTKFSTKIGDKYVYAETYYKETYLDGKGNMLSIKCAKQKVTIQKINVESMNEVSRKEYTDFLPDCFVYKILKINNKIYYFYGQLNKSRSRSIYAREVTLDGLLLAPIFLFETKGETKFVNLEVSKDQSKVLISYKRVNKQKIDKLSYDVLGFYSVDGDLKKITGGEVVMPYTEAAMNNGGFTIGSDGTAYMLAFINGSENIELFVIKGEAILKKVKLSFSGILFLDEIKMSFNTDGAIVCTGYYANGIEYSPAFSDGVMVSRSNINGLMRFKVSVDGDVIEKKQYEFPIELINQYNHGIQKNVNNYREKNKKAGVENLKLINLIDNEDGTTLVIGEERYFESLEVSANNIIMTKLDKDDNLLWMIKLPKKQSIDMDFTFSTISYKFIQIGSYYYLFFLDTNNNLDRAFEELDTYKGWMDSSNLSYFQVNMTTGTFSRHKIISTKDLSVENTSLIRPSDLFTVSEKVYMLEISNQRLKESKMMEIKFDK